MTVKIYIVTEILSRELLGNLLLAALLASRGHIAIILNQEDTFSLSSGSISGTTIFHAKSIHYSHQRIIQHTKLRDDGFLITSQDQETLIVNRDVASRVSERFCEENLNLVERIYVWSDSEADEISRQFPRHSPKIMVTGSPREDIWSKRFRSVAGTQSRKRKRILIVSNNDGANHRMRHWEQMLMIKSVTGPATDPSVFDHFVEDVFDGLKSQLFFSRLALELADGFPECDVIVQPKKNEITESWVQTLIAVDKGDGTRENLILETSRLLEESIHSSDLVINANSTAGITALIGEVPLISIGPTFSLASEVGMQLEQGDDILGAVGEALNDPEGFVNAYRTISRKTLGNRVRPPSATMAAEKIVEDLESLDSENGSSALTFRDMLLYLAPGSVRRFASAIKSLLTLKSPVRPFSEMVMTVSHAQVNDYLGRLYEGLGTNLNVKVSVAGGRNIIVSPRRNK